MPDFTNPAGSTQRYIPAVNRNQNDRIPGTKKIAVDHDELLVKVGEERECIAMGIPVWYDGVDIQCKAEPLSVLRRWALSTDFSSAGENAEASHARSVVIGPLARVLASDENRVHATSGLPASGVGSEGDLALDADAGIVYLKSGGWSELTTLYAPIEVEPVDPTAPFIHNAEKIQPMLQALANAGSTRATLAFHGHSIVKGAGADQPAGTTGQTAVETLAAARLWRTQSLGPRIAEALSAAVGGTAGIGVEVPSVGQALQFTLSGGATISGIYSPGGAHGRIWNLSAPGDGIEFPAQGASVRVYGYALLTGLAARYQINGGSVQTAPAAGSDLTGTGNAVWYEFTISGLTAGDTVKVLGPTSSGIRITGVDFDHKTGPGVTVHRIAEGDKMGCQIVATYLDSTDTQPAGGWVQADPGGTNVRHAQATSVTHRLGIVGALNMFDVNDIKGYNYQGQSWGWMLPVLERHLKNYLTWMASQNLTVLLVLGPYRNPDIANTAGTPYTQQDIINLYKTVSDWSTNCAYIDLTDEFQSPGSTLHQRYAYQQSFAYHMDGVHPNAGGCQHYAQRIATAIANAASASAE